jgi:ribonuclease P protein component
LIESYRKIERRVDGGYDLVFVAQKDLSGAKYTDIEQGVKRLLKKGRILK